MRIIYRSLKVPLQLVVLTVLATSAHVSQAAAAGACPSPPFGGPSFVIVRPPPPESVPSAQLEDFKVRISIINGSPARPQDWPATFIVCTSDGKFCTGTTVGVRVMLTAAHCFDRVRNGPGPVNGIFQLDRAQKPIPVSCTAHPDYRPFDKNEYERNGKRMKREWSADVAVCKAETDLPVELAENLAAERGAPKSGARLILLGYGCTLTGGGGAVHTLYIGPATVKEVQEDNYYIHTSDGDRGNAVVCDGDSGGASYNQDKRPRVVDGINSLTDKQSDSWITDVTRPEIRKFIRDQSNDVPGQVCGLQPTAARCAPR